MTVSTHPRQKKCQSPIFGFPERLLYQRMSLLMRRYITDT
jgi:hypothetical protein